MTHRDPESQKPDWNQEIWQLRHRNRNRNQYSLWLYHQSNFYLRFNTFYHLEVRLGAFLCFSGPNETSIFCYCRLSYYIYFQLPLQWRIAVFMKLHIGKQTIIVYVQRSLDWRMTLRYSFIWNMGVSLGPWKHKNARFGSGLGSSKEIFFTAEVIFLPFLAEYYAIEVPHFP